jgi:NADPH-dependent curcumin reductase CurA
VLGRVAVCGMISGYNEAGTRTNVRNLSNIIYGRMTLRGFTAADFMPMREQFLSDMAGWLREGRIKHAETVYDGIENAPAAMIDLMAGANLGKMLVKLAD